MWIMHCSVQYHSEKVFYVHYFCYITLTDFNNNQSVKRYLAWYTRLNNRASKKMFAFFVCSHNLQNIMWLNYILSLIINIMYGYWTKFKSYKAHYFFNFIKYHSSNIFVIDIITLLCVLINPIYCILFL